MERREKDKRKAVLQAKIKKEVDERRARLQEEAQRKAEQLLLEQQQILEDAFEEVTGNQQRQIHYQDIGANFMLGAPAKEELPLPPARVIPQRYMPPKLHVVNPMPYPQQSYPMMYQDQGSLPAVPALSGSYHPIDARGT